MLLCVLLLLCLARVLTTLIAFERQERLNNNLYHLWLPSGFFSIYLHHINVYIYSTLNSILCRILHDTSNQKKLNILFSVYLFIGSKAMSMEFTPVWSFTYKSKLINKHSNTLRNHFYWKRPFQPASALDNITLNTQIFIVFSCTKIKAQFCWLVLTASKNSKTILVVILWPNRVTSSAISKTTVKQRKNW